MLLQQEKNLHPTDFVQILLQYSFQKSKVEPHMKLLESI